MPIGTLVACALAGHSALDPPARSALEVVAQQLVIPASVRVEYVMQGHAGEPLERRVIAVAASGAYSEIFFDPAPAGKASASRHAGFLFFDGTNLRQSRPGTGQEYEVIEMPELASRAPGPMQWQMVPWPIASFYVEWLKQSSDLTHETGDEGIWFRSPSAGLAMRLAHNGVIRAIRREYAGGGFHQFDFDGFLSSPGGTFPTRMTWSARLTSSATGKVTEFVRQYSAECRSPADRADLEFDAVALNAAKYDVATGDVIHPTLGLLYNVKQVESQMNANSWYYRLRPWAFGVAGVGVAASIFIGYRRLRSAS